MKCLCIGVCSL